MIIESGIASESQLEGWEAADKEAVEAARDLAWEAFQAPIRTERDGAVAILRRVDMPEVAEITNALDEAHKITRSFVMASATRALFQLRGLESPARTELAKFVDEYRRQNLGRYNSHLYSSSADSPLNVEAVPPSYSDKSATVDGRQVLLRNFDANFARDPRIFVIGEDVGKLGDVNLVFEGLQAKYGALRLTDTGIREATILGQAIGAAMRGLRPICDIQYLDYFLYATNSFDDLASLHWRTVGGQKGAGGDSYEPPACRDLAFRLADGCAPACITRRVCRGSAQHDAAAGFYNTLFVATTRGRDRGLERLPARGRCRTTSATSPSAWRAGVLGKAPTPRLSLALAAVSPSTPRTLEELGVSCEVIDVRPNRSTSTTVVARLKNACAHLSRRRCPGRRFSVRTAGVLEVQQGWWPGRGSAPLASSRTGRPTGRT
jgi:hypothetical protein